MPLAGEDRALQGRRFRGLDQPASPTGRRVPVTVGQQVKRDLQEVGEDAANQTVDALISETTTDWLIDQFAEMAPWGLGWMIRGFLDNLLPDAAAGILKDLIAEAFAAE